jgi:hypothetical protein
MKEIYLLIIAILLMCICFFLLTAYVAYNAEAVEMTASVQPNPCSICLELCR